MTRLVSFFEIDQEKSWWAVMFDYSHDYVEIMEQAGYEGQLTLHPGMSHSVNARIRGEKAAKLMCDFRRAGARVRLHEMGSWAWSENG